MSATVIREKRQTTLPSGVVDAAGLQPGDQVEWHFAEGEIRGRKLAPVAPRQIKARLVKKEGGLFFEAPGVQFDPDAIADAVRDERDSR